MKKIITIVGLSFFCSNIMLGQDVEYNKKKNTYVSKEVVIAKFEPKKNGFGTLRSFLVQDLQEKNLIEFLYTGVTDTFGRYHDWYEVLFPSLGLRCTNAGSPELNGEKYFANIPIEHQMLQNTGALDENACKLYVKKSSYDHKSVFDAYNDSLKALVSGERPIVMRSKKFPPYADNMGRIGQNDIVIGKWDSYTKPKVSFNSTAKPDRTIFIKNSVGTILAIYSCGTTTFTVFADKKRSVDLNPGATKEFTGNEPDILIVNRIASELVSRGLL